ncbi:MAG: hypothetical protein M5U26_08550 [Planctomycetota bacterium]|nr:hypothetical protein [Planctomycetota bacterium]
MLRRILVLCFILGFCLGQAFGGEPAAPRVEYLVWDAHRFARTAEDFERDVRFLKDLGFTHSLMAGTTRSKKDGEAQAARLADAFKAFEKHGLVAGLRFAWEFDEFPMSPEERIAAGVQLKKKTGGEHPTYNPMHPKVVEYYAEAFKRAIEEYKKADSGNSLKWFLIGTERTWDLPKPEEAHPQALEAIFAAAREDGILKEGETDLAKLGAWWGGAHGWGRDWRLRKAVEDTILARIPDAEFFVDPIWAVKIVHGFGGDWSYIDGDPRHIADAVLRLKAMCRPAPVIHSTQLIRGAYRDCVLEANLLALCMGAEKLYHWGVHTIEPGAEANPFYRQKVEKTPEKEKELVEALRAKRREKEPALRATGRILRERGALFARWKPLAQRVALLSGVYGGEELNQALLAAHVPFDILREQGDRRANMKKYAVVASAKPAVSLEDYKDLLEMEQAGATIMLPADFAYPEGLPRLSKVVTWDPDFMLPKEAPDAAGKTKRAKSGLAGTPAERRALLHAWGAELSKVFAAAGFKPCFDSANRDVVIGSYEYGGAKLAFLVNDLRQGQGEDGAVEHLGVDNEVELRVRDERDGLKALDLDTGEELKFAKAEGGWKLVTTVPAAWYKLIAILGPGESWKGAGPLPAAPAVTALEAAREGAGVKLSWKLPFDDWVGCDVERYELLRGEAGAEPAKLVEIDGRNMTGPGGVVTEYLDATAKAGTVYVYQLRALSPLRTAGPLSPKAEARRFRISD